MGFLNRSCCCHLSIIEKWLISFDLLTESTYLLHLTLFVLVFSFLLHLWIFFLLRNLIVVWVGDFTEHQFLGSLPSSSNKSEALDAFETIQSRTPTLKKHMNEWNYLTTGAHIVSSRKRVNNLVLRTPTWTILRFESNCILLLFIICSLQQTRKMWHNVKITQHTKKPKFSVAKEKRHATWNENKEFYNFVQIDFHYLLSHTKYFFLLLALLLHQTSVRLELVRVSKRAELMAAQNTQWETIFFFVYIKLFFRFWISFEAANKTWKISFLSIGRYASMSLTSSPTRIQNPTQIFLEFSICFVVWRERDDSINWRWGLKKSYQIFEINEVNSLESMTELRLINLSCSHWMLYMDMERVSRRQ